MIILFTVMLLVLLAIGLPVGFALGTGGLVGMLLFMGGDGTLNQIPLLAYKSLDDFVLCAVPLYVMMSQILLEGKVGNDLFELGNKWLRHLPGGLGAATIVACGIFAAITGSSAACAVTIGAIAIPEMLKRNFDALCSDGYNERRCGRRNHQERESGCYCSLCRLDGSGLGRG